MKKDEVPKNFFPDSETASLTLPGEATKRLLSLFHSYFLYYHSFILFLLSFFYSFSLFIIRLFLFVSLS